MGDACCGHVDATPGVVDGEPTRFWQICEVRAAAVAGVFLVAGLIADVGDAGGAADGLFLAALVVGGSTFVPRHPAGAAAGSPRCRDVDDDRRDGRGDPGRAR